MGNKQSTSKSVHENSLDPNKLKHYEYQNDLAYNSNKYLRSKRRPNGNHLDHTQMSRSTSSPLVAKNNRPTSNSEQQPTPSLTVQPRLMPIPQLTQPPQYLAPKLNQVFVTKQAKTSAVISMNYELKSKQLDLTTAIKKLDSQPVQDSHINGSKLYKPNSLMLAATMNSHQIPSNHNKKHLPPNVHLPNNKSNQDQSTGYNTLPNKNSNLAMMTNNYNNQKNEFKNANLKPSKSTEGLTQKVSKKLGLSPKFKRKIVETIANRVNGGNSNPGGKSRLLQALQSQWNLFTSIRMSRSNLNEGDENDDENYFKKRRHTTVANQNNNNGSTFLSMSVERNSFRYASRRKYKTQSLANPYRHADTNYPVYTHEALFMPEFSVKGQVTEADFEILDVISRGAFGHVIKVKMKKTSAVANDAM